MNAVQDEPRPVTTCLLHVPKSAGVSMHRALLAALPGGSVAPQRADLSGLRIFSNLTDFDRLSPSMREGLALNAADIEALRDYRAVCGHFMLRSLLRVAPLSRICTVLREPRARLLSLYLYFRLDAPVRALWSPYDSPIVSAAMQSLETFLSDARLARATDNQMCRMLLDDDERIRADEFIAPADAGNLAAAALDRLDRFGFVGVMESPVAAWTGVSRMFRVRLQPVSVNVTGARELDPDGFPVPHPDPDKALQLLDERSAADRIVYETFLLRQCGSSSEARHRAGATFVTQIERFGRVSGEQVSDLAEAALASRVPG